MRAFIVCGLFAQMDTEAGGFVAIKKARCGFNGIPASVFAEIKALQELRHANVVQVRALGVVAFPHEPSSAMLPICCFS